MRVIPADPPPLTAPSRAEARARLGLDDRPRALLLGIIRAYKGIGIVADAWPAVHAALPDAELVVAGSLPEPLADFDRLAALDAVDLHIGWMSDDDMLLWAAAADVCVLPYAHGVHSAIMHNAVVAETPVLASPCLADELERLDAGRIVPLDPAQWSIAIIDALGAHPLPLPAPPARRAGEGDHRRLRGTAARLGNGKCGGAGAPAADPVRVVDQHDAPARDARVLDRLHRGDDVL